MERLLLTPEEAAEALAVCRDTVYLLVRAGELASVKIGTARRIPKAALQQFIDDHVGAD